MGMSRDEALTDLQRQPEVSVLVVGGGINGIGTFRDLALNGVDVLLVERGDFCSGASAASSHMAHGGIRYLENGEFRLVREAVRERNYMIEHAPHLVRPLPTTIPIFRVFSGLLNAPLKFLGLLDRPAERGSLVIKVGLMLYDAYTGRQRTVPRHRFMGRAQSLRQWPSLNPAIVHTATYYDGAILHPERLGLELVLDAEAANPKARAINYLSLEDCRGGSVILRDARSGQEFEVRPRVLVNAAGPWIDFANRALGSETRFIGGTKGSHIVVDHQALREAIGDHEFFFENEDGRIVLIFPLYDKVLVGTSDLPANDPDAVRCTEPEVDYFLELVRRIFPEIRLSRENIVYRFSGVRPLAAGKSKTAGQITRDHEIKTAEADATGLPFPVLSLVGGKWTSWRAFSEQVTDECLGRLGLRRHVDTWDLEIGGGQGYPRNAEEQQRFAQRIAEILGQKSSEGALALVERYGTRAVQMAKFLAEEPDSTLTALPGYTRREFAYIATREKVVHLDDVLQRRTNLAMLGQLTDSGVREIAAVLAQYLHWDGSSMEREISGAIEILVERHQARI